MCSEPNVSKSIRSETAYNIYYNAIELAIKSSKYFTSSLWETQELKHEQQKYL